MSAEKIIKLLTEKGLKVTPQRIAVYRAVAELGNHPTAEQVKEYLMKDNPNIAIGTVYKILETMVENKIIGKVKTDFGVMSYDAVLDKHHHLYCAESNKIEDYYDENLNKLIEGYFENKKIKNFEIQDVKLQIIGNFRK